MKNTSIEFVGLGFCSNDYLCRVPELVFDGKMEISELMVQGGGPGGGATVAAAKLGMKTAFVTTLGDDADGVKMTADFEADGVDTSAIRRYAGRKSPIAYCLITPDGKRTVAWTKNRIPDLTAADLPVEMIKNAKVLHLDGHHTDVAIEAAKIAKAAGVLVSIDAGTQRPRIDELLDLADIVIASEAFCRKWGKTESLETGLRVLEKHHNLVTAVTAGVEGSYYIDADDGVIRHVPSVRISPVIDTTGAGDSFHGAFVYRYLQCRDTRKAMEFAAVFAALKCRKLGARAGQPTLAEVKEFAPGILG